MTSGVRRAQRVAELIKEEIGSLLIREFQDSSTGFLTVTRVDMTADLLTARITLSVFGPGDRKELLERLEKSRGYFRKILASRVKLKYNPQLFFELDQGPEYEKKIDRLIEMTKKHDT